MPKGPARRAAAGRLLASVFALLFGCGSHPTEPPAVAARPNTTAPPAQADASKTSGARGSDSAAGDVLVNQALVVVSHLRELTPVGPVRGRIIDRPAMLEHVRKQLRTEVPESAVKATTEMLFLLGVVPSDFEYEKSLLLLLESQLAGFYEPKDKTMYLLADLSAIERQATLSHELVHALQDQHYDLGKLVEWRDDTSDELSAIHALAEGDATSAMLDQMLEPQGKRAIDLSDDLLTLQTRGMMELSPSIASVPTIIKRSVLAPYTDGLMFVHSLRRRSGWSAVDAVWRNLPKTTEQLLHPDKFAAREPAESLPVPKSTAGMPATVLYHDILGEQSVRLLFEEWMPRATAVAAASGWSGDRIAVVAEGQRFALAWHLRWDDERTARRGFEAFSRGLLRAEAADPSPGQAPNEPPPADAKAVNQAAVTGRACRERSRHGAFAAVRKGRDVVVVAGPMRRNPSGPTSDGNCANAFAWAAVVVDQR